MAVLPAQDRGRVLHSYLFKEYPAENGGVGFDMEITKEFIDKNNCRVVECCGSCDNWTIVVKPPPGQWERFCIKAQCEVEVDMVCDLYKLDEKYESGYYDYPWTQWRKDINKAGGLT